MRLAPRLALMAMVVLVPQGCGGDPAPAEAFTVVDSAGVEIVTSSHEGWGTDGAWTLGEAPVVLGGPESGLGEAEELWRVMAMPRLPDGSVAVLSAGNHQIHIFDADGARARTFGRRGEGPGELLRPASMAFRAPDTLMVLDAIQLELFDLAGTPQGTERAELLRGAFGGGTGVSPMMILPDRTLFGRALRRQEGPTPAGVRRPPTGYALIRPDGTPVLLGYYPGIEQERLETGSGVRAVVAPFAASTAFAVNALPQPTYLIADTEHYAVEVFDGQGQLTRVVRRAVDPVPVQDEWVEAWKEEQRNMRWTQGQQDQVEVGWNLMTVRETLPALEAMALDSLGHLWVQRPGIPGSSSLTFDVFDPDGRFQGQV